MASVGCSVGRSSFRARIPAPWASRRCAWSPSSSPASERRNPSSCPTSTASDSVWAKRPATLSPSRGWNQGQSDLARRSGLASSVRARACHERWPDDRAGRRHPHPLDPPGRPPPHPIGRRSGRSHPRQPRPDAGQPARRRAAARLVDRLEPATPARRCRLRAPRGGAPDRRQRVLRSAGPRRRGSLPASIRGVLQRW